MSEKSSSSSSSGGIGFAGLLTIVFITLKLVGEHFHTPVAEWSWLWVLSPLWLSAVLVLGILLVAFIVYMFTKLR